VSKQALSNPASGQRPDGSPRIRRLIDVLALVLMLSAISATLVAVLVLLSERTFAQRIYPNVSIRGVAVGSMQRHEAQAALNQHFADFLANPIELRYAGRTWHPNAETIGLRLVLDDAISTALQVGHHPSRIDSVRSAAAVWENGVDLPLRVTIDQHVMQQYLLTIAAGVDTPARNADIRVNGTDIHYTPESWGVQVLVDATLHDMTAAVQSLERQSIDLRTRTLAPRVRDTDVAPIDEELRILLSAPIVLESTSSACSEPCRWVWSQPQIADWINLRHHTTTDGAPLLTLSIDQAAIRSALVPIAAELRVEGGLPLVDWNDGNLTIMQPGTPGEGLDADQALVEINNALYSEQRRIQLPMASLPPPVTEFNLNSLGITTEVAAGISSFANSEQYRITNIIAGARRMHGHLIAPGASFSFNTNLGPVNAANGFVEGLAIINNRTQKEWGGGLCQVSTTVFRAAFWAGLPITERHEHSFRIGWYEELGEPPGLDAAIFTGVNDVRFVNDSGGWLLMQTRVDQQRQRLYVLLYGPPGQRSVTLDYQILERTPAPTTPVYIDDPELPAGTVRKTDSARGGLHVEVYRTVSAAGTVIARDTFTTLFQPWPNIYVRGTDTR
jgi:vancomycin resistance protein YoaR